MTNASQIGLLQVMRRPTAGNEALPHYHQLLVGGTNRYAIPQPIDKPILVGIFNRNVQGVNSYLVPGTWYIPIPRYVTSGNLVQFHKLFPRVL